MSVHFRFLIAAVAVAPISLAIVTLSLSATMAQAQFGPGGAINPGKDCQTILRCRFRRGGTYRGCISAYVCRQCRFVRARCERSGARRVCRRLQCSW